MPWVRLDDTFYDHPKIARLSAGAVGVWVQGLAYCNRHLTDGFIPNRIIARFCDGAEADELVSAGLLFAVDGGWQYHDYHDYQPSREQAQARAQAKSDAGRKGAEARWNGNSHGNSHGKPMANGIAESWPVPLSGKTHGNSHRRWKTDPPNPSASVKEFTGHNFPDQPARPPKNPLKAVEEAS